MSDLNISVIVIVFHDDKKYSSFHWSRNLGLMFDLHYASKDFNIDLSQSYMIGDSDSDVEAGRNAGVRKSLKIETGEGKTLLDLVNVVLSY